MNSIKDIRKVHIDSPIEAINTLLVCVGLGSLVGIVVILVEHYSIIKLAIK